MSLTQLSPSLFLIFTNHYKTGFKQKKEISKQEIELIKHEIKVLLLFHDRSSKTFHKIRGRLIKKTCTSVHKLRKSKQILYFLNPIIFILLFLSLYPHHYPNDIKSSILSTFHLFLFTVPLIHISHNLCTIPLYSYPFSLSLYP